MLAWLAAWVVSATTAVLSPSAQCDGMGELHYIAAASVLDALIVVACAPIARAIGLMGRKDDDVWIAALDLESILLSSLIAPLATYSTLYGGATAYDRWIGDANSPDNTLTPGLDSCGCGAMGVCWIVNLLMAARAIGTIPFYFIAEGGIFKKGEGRWLMVVHHSIVAFGCAASMYVARGRWYGTAMAVAEWSNPFVAIKQLAQRMPRRSLDLEAVNGVLLAITFITTRLVGIPLVAVAYVNDWRFARDEAQTPLVLHNLWLVSGVAMFGFSFYWAFPVLRSAARKWTKAAVSREKTA